MVTVGIICEYNPLHNGHAKQLRLLRERFGDDCRIVCLMSGNYVQRGEPAVFDKQIRAKAAIACGADAVLELPLQYALSSAEGFAAGGVHILTELGIEWLCFGSETGDGNLLMSTAEALLQPQIDEGIRTALQQGISYAAAREQALSAIYPEGAALLHSPNDILAVEYCKAVLRQSSRMKICPILRQGDYHSEAPDTDNPSATALRLLLAQNADISAYVPAAAATEYVEATQHTMAAGERALLARLKSMTEAEFSAAPYGSEGLWRRFMRNCRDCNEISSVVAQTKTKRYAETRIRRMLLCAFLGITETDLQRPAEYVRILAFSDAGREVLRSFRGSSIPVIGVTKKRRNSQYFSLETHCESLYFLFERDFSAETQKK